MGQGVQPSTALEAPSEVPAVPAGQESAWQLLAVPPSEKVPAAHGEHPSVGVLAPSVVEIWPGGHCRARHIVAAPPSEKPPS
jgi:hypothetical protein